MSVEIIPLGRHDLRAKIDGPHGTRPVVGIAYREVGSPNPVTTTGYYFGTHPDSMEE